MAAAAVAMAFLLCAVPALASNVVLQDVDLVEYPLVRVDVALTADLVPETGEPAFTVLENGIEAQNVSAEVATQDRPPVDVVLLIDASGSMEGAPLAAAKEAAKRFAAAMRPSDRVAVVSFSTEPRTVRDFGSDATALVGAIDSLQASGETALYDGLIQATKLFTAQERDRAIVVLSDGGDTMSINTLDAAAKTLSEVAVPLYAVALTSEEYNPTALEQLASRSGGRFVTAEAADSLVDIFEQIAEELRNLYSLTFESARPATTDLEIEIIATNGDASGALTTVIENPTFADAPRTEDAPSRNRTGLARFGIPVLSMLVFAAVTLAAFGAGSLLLPTPNAMQQLDYYGQYDENADPLQDAAMRGGRAKVMNVVSTFAEARGFTAMARSALERAGLPLRPNEYIFFHVLSAAVTALLVNVLAQNLFLTTVVTVLVVFGPIIAIRIKIDRRKARFEEQLPDVLSLIAGSLRAGWGIQQGLELVVEEISDPAASEFRRVQSEARFGLPLEQALARMAERLDSEDFRWTVTAIAIQRDVGGNLAEVLDIVSTTIRTRAELRRHVKALTAESRFSAMVLAAMPFVIMGALTIVNPLYIGPMFTSPIGIGAMLFGLVLLAIGIFWILRLTRLEV